TMKQIAAELNLSRSAVSYALDHRWQAKRIPPQTRTRVLTKALELGYRPNHVARSLRTRVTQTIGILAPTIAGEFMYRMLRGLEAVMGDRYTFVLGVSEWEAARERQLIESFEERMVDAVLVLSS